MKLKYKGFFVITSYAINRQSAYSDIPDQYPWKLNQNQCNQNSKVVGPCSGPYVGQINIKGLWFFEVWLYFGQEHPVKLSRVTLC